VPALDGRSLVTAINWKSIEVVAKYHPGLTGALRSLFFLNAADWQRQHETKEAVDYWTSERKRREEFVPGQGIVGWLKINLRRISSIKIAVPWTI
jgi:hypothetical protein